MIDGSVPVHDQLTAPPGRWRETAAVSLKMIQKALAFAYNMFPPTAEHFVTK